MRRKDLDTAAIIAPGLYLIDGDDGDPDGLIVGGPYPDSENGRVAAMELAAQLHHRTRRPASVALVVDLPR